MKTFLLALTLITAPAFIFSSIPSHAAEKARKSPHETLKAEVDGNQMTIVYGRPFTKDPKTGKARKIWGSLVPYGKVWRTGADEATLLTTQKPIVIGSTTVPAGTYSLYTLPMKEGTSKLVINKETGQWGTNYDEKQDLARVDLAKETPASPTNQFTMMIEKQPSGGGGGGGGGALKMSWDDTEFAVPFTVANSK